MNKKFSTLMAGLMLASAFSVSRLRVRSNWRMSMLMVNIICWEIQRMDLSQLIQLQDLIMVD